MSHPFEMTVTLKARNLDHALELLAEVREIANDCGSSVTHLSMNREYLTSVGGDPIISGS
jgi:hypothetical protein